MTLVVDIRHWLTEDGEPVPALRRRVLHIARLIEYGGPLKVGQARETLVDIPGAAAAVIEDGRITMVRGFGRRDREGHPVTAQTPFQLASLSKSFTALVILQLAAEGRLAIDDPVIEYVPPIFAWATPHTRAPSPCGIS